MNNSDDTGMNGIDEAAARLSETMGVIWTEGRPDDRSCEECGEHMEPVAHPFREDLWIAPGARCNGCSHREWKEAEEREKRAERFEYEWKRAGVPKLIQRHIKSSGFQMHSLLDKFVTLDPRGDHRVWGLYVHGPVGTGKSTQAGMAAHRFLAHWILNQGRHLTARYINIERVLQQEKESWKDDSKRVDWSAIWGADLLVIDDLARERATEWAGSKVDVLIEHRYSELLHTVFISNVELENLSPNDDEGSGHGNYDDRISGRIYEMCGGTTGKLADVELDQQFRTPNRGQQ